MSAPGLRISPDRLTRAAAGACTSTTYWILACGTPLKVVEKAATAEIAEPLQGRHNSP